jgi:hypothetical protein
MRKRGRTDSNIPKNRRQRRSRKNNDSTHQRKIFGKM